MIHPKCFRQNWLEEQAAILQARDVRNLEKCILALELVGRLQQAGLEFIFKGGTSLILLLDPVRRLSIDVDILCLEPLDRLKEILDKIAKDKHPFLSWTYQDHRDREAPPTRHFQVYYHSEISMQGAPSIQIDVMETGSPYAQIEEVLIRTDFIELEEEVFARVPSASSLLADKLAAFAPTTIGYPYQPIGARTGLPGEPRPIKVIKHLYDLGELASLPINLTETLTTYDRILAEQLEFRKGDWTREQTLDDSQEAAFLISRIGGKRFKPSERSIFLENGIRALDSHLFTMPFQKEQARISASRAALIAEIVRHRAADYDLNDALNRTPTLDDILDDPWQDLQRLRSTDPKAFTTWHAAQELRSRRKLVQIETE